MSVFLKASYEPLNKIEKANSLIIAARYSKSAENTGAELLTEMRICFKLMN